jgi:hypothetical protein
MVFVKVYLTGQHSGKASFILWEGAAGSDLDRSITHLKWQFQRLVITEVLPFTYRNSTLT